MAIELRSATPADPPQLARMGAALAHQHHQYDAQRFIFPEGMEDGYAWWFAQELKNSDAILLVATRDGAVLGYAYGTSEDRDWNALLDACGHFHDLWVEPSARGLGVGRLLAEGMLDAFLKRASPRVVLGTASQNRAAQSLFKKLGWRATMVEMTREL